MSNKSYDTRLCLGMALDPIHIGTGGSRLGRVDNTIVRDPVTGVPKIPGSSLAGVCRAYAAMAKNKYPKCAGQGGETNDKKHCSTPDCPICTVFGTAGDTGGFAGLAGFGDMHVLLFPVATEQGPVWVTSPEMLRRLPNLENMDDPPEPDSVYYNNSDNCRQLNLGWLMLPVKNNWSQLDQVKEKMKKFNLPQWIQAKIAVVSDKLFSQVVNSNLEVRTSVSINPATGAAEDGALFTYEALPRSTALQWPVICRDPNHFQINGDKIRTVNSTSQVFQVVAQAHPFLEHLGIGGMGTRGLGRLRVYYPDKKTAQVQPEQKQTGGGA